MCNFHTTISFYTVNFIHIHVKILRTAVTSFHELVSPVKALCRNEQTEITEANGRKRNLIYNEHLLPTRDNALSELYCRQSGLVCGTNYILSVNELFECQAPHYHTTVVRCDGKQLANTEAAQPQWFNSAKTRGATGHEAHPHAHGWVNAILQLPARSQNIFPMCFCKRILYVFPNLAICPADRSLQHSLS